MLAPIGKQSTGQLLYQDDRLSCCGTRHLRRRETPSSSADRCHSLTSLDLPLAALGSLPVKIGNANTRTSTEMWSFSFCLQVSTGHSLRQDDRLPLPRKYVMPPQSLDRKVGTYSAFDKFLDCNLVVEAMRASSLSN